MHIQTVTGRFIPAPPSLDGDTNRKNTNRIKKLDEWLKIQAQAEAQSRNDGYNSVWIDQLKLGNFSPTDRDLINVYLFGEERPFWNVTAIQNGVVPMSIQRRVP